LRDPTLSFAAANEKDGATSVVELVVSHPSHKNKGVARIRPTGKDPYVGTPGPGHPTFFATVGSQFAVRSWPGKFLVTQMAKRHLGGPLEFGPR
jgi:hypothetical protein